MADLPDYCASGLVANAKCFTPADWSTYNAGLAHQAPLHIPYVDSAGGMFAVFFLAVALTLWFTRTPGQGWHVTVPRFLLVTVPTFAGNVARGIRAPR